ncbi:hypothetical protein [Lysobacter enzymogenes]|uniref:hypothetical protein n=1 Tax=Lysobacter enzymogenes TaxID=69 RepID=UPI0019D0FA8E|nr:hypothetical protein [Lysobacter enzymogenes]
MSRNRSEASRARQRRGLIRDALAVVGALSDSRLLQLAPGIPPSQHRAELLTFAEREPRRALTAFAKETNR